MLKLMRSNSPCALRSTTSSSFVSNARKLPSSCKNGPTLQRFLKEGVIISAMKLHRLWLIVQQRVSKPVANGLPPRAETRWSLQHIRKWKLQPM